MVRLDLVTLALATVYSSVCHASTLQRAGPSRVQKRHECHPPDILPSRFDQITIEQPACEFEDRCAIPCFYLTREKDEEIRTLISEAYKRQIGLNTTQVNSRSSTIVELMSRFSQFRGGRANAQLLEAQHYCRAVLEGYQVAIGTVGEPDMTRRLVNAVSRLTPLKELVGKGYVEALYARLFAEDLQQAYLDGCGQIKYHDSPTEPRHSISAEDPYICMAGLGADHTISIPEPRPFRLIGSTHT